MVLPRVCKRWASMPSPIWAHMGIDLHMLCDRDPRHQRPLCLGEVSQVSHSVLRMSLSSTSTVVLKQRVCRAGM